MYHTHMTSCTQLLGIIILKIRVSVNYLSYSYIYAWTTMSE